MSTDQKLEACEYLAMYKQHKRTCEESIKKMKIDLQITERVLSFVKSEVSRLEKLCPEPKGDGNTVTADGLVQ